MDIQETVILSRDNTIDRKLIADGAVLSVAQMQAITRIDVVLNGQTFNSQDDPEAFDWSTREDEGVVILKLGSLSINLGTDMAADLIVYDAASVNGILWDRIAIKVEQG